MKKLIATLAFTTFLLVPAYADDVWDDVKDAVEDERDNDDDRPGQHGRDNAERAQENNPGKGSKGDDDDSLWDDIDDDDKKKGQKKNKNK